jgi:hypothetical protein
MAIKVNGTTVINDSRQLQNVASLDATTVAALGAAGIGGGVDTGTTLPSDASGGAGDLFFVTSLFKLYIHNGTAWKQFSGQSFSNYTAYYYNRINSSESLTVPFTGSGATGWGFGGNNVDAVTINMSGIGTYKLGGLSMGIWASSPPPSTACRVLVAQGSDTGGTQVFEGPVLLPDSNGLIDFSASPVTLNKGQTYTVGFSFPDGAGGSQARNFSGLAGTMTGSLGTLTVNTATFGGSAPYASSNGTAANSGQHPFFSFSN